jgi:hypothetical protein
MARMLERAGAQKDASALGTSMVSVASAQGQYPGKIISTHAIHGISYQLTLFTVYLMLIER